MKLRTLSEGQGSDDINANCFYGSSSRFELLNELICILLHLDSCQHVSGDCMIMFMFISRHRELKL